MGKKNRRVLIITSRPRWQTLARLPVLFHQAGAEVDVLAMGRGVIHLSRYVRSVPVNAKSMPDFISALREYMVTHGGSYDFVMLGDEFLIDAICQEREKDWLVPWFPVDPWSEAFHAIARKDHFNQLSEKHGVSVPRNISCQNFTEVEQAAEQIGFPVMLKSHLGTSGNGVQKADDRIMLRNLYFSRSKADMEQLSVQEYISGKVGFSFVLARRGQVIQAYSCYKTKTWPGPFGPSSVLTTVEHPDLKKLCISVAAMTGFHGIFGCDWMESNVDGRFRIVEFNPRSITLTYVGRFFGLSLADDLPVLWGDREVPNCPHTISRPGMVRKFPQDFQRSIVEGDWHSFWLNLQDTILLRNDVPWHDPFEVSLEVGRTTKILLKHLFRQH